jgi:hypothetical protein
VVARRPVLILKVRPTESPSDRQRKYVNEGEAGANLLSPLLRPTLARHAMAREEQMRKVALLVVTSFGLAACSDSIFSPDCCRRTEPQFSSLSVGVMQPAPQASERQAWRQSRIDPAACTASHTWLTC